VLCADDGPTCAIFKDCDIKNFVIVVTDSISNTGHTNITGNVALIPGPVVEGFPPGTIIGEGHVNDSDAAAALNTSECVRDVLTNLTVTDDLSGTLLKNVTLTPGVYTFNDTTTLQGNVTFDGAGNISSIFVIIINGTFTVDPKSRVVLTNGTQPGNIFFVSTGDVAIGTNATFSGWVLTTGDIDLASGVVANSRLYTNAGAMTLISDTVHVVDCVTSPESTTTTGSTTGVTPAGSSLSNSQIALVIAVPASIALVIIIGVAVGIAMSGGAAAGAGTTSSLARKRSRSREKRHHRRMDDEEDDA